MELRNHTPFTSFVFYSVDPSDREFGVALLRGDFTIDRRGLLVPLPEGAVVVKSDVYVGKPGRSSIYYESDLVPFKPASDIIAHADAIPPDERLNTSWLVSLRVGAHEKSLRITGPRRWRRRFAGGWTLDAPAACERVRLSYELAFGGSDANGAYDKNPVGRGYSPPTSDNDDWGPQIEDPGAPIQELRGPYKPAGFGPIARDWQPRLGLAGRFDEAWRRERAPRLPLDFSYHHYNCAPPGLNATFLRGDEEVVAHGLNCPGRRAFRLPGLGAALVGRLKDGRHAVAPMFLDTLWIDFSRDLVRLTWRGSFGAPGTLAGLAFLATPARA